jgi:hypothetical protein
MPTLIISNKLFDSPQQVLMPGYLSITRHDFRTSSSYEQAKKMKHEA